MKQDEQTPHIRVALFATCLADLFRPSVAFATVALLRRAGCEVEVPDAQTCCGQPGYNAGDMVSSRAVARRFITAFEGYRYVVAPSGSCTAMVKQHYPALLADDPEWHARALALAPRCHELTSFLVDVLKVDPARLVGRGTPLKVCYHDSCAGLRELGVKQQPRQLLAAMANVELSEMAETEVCCGFGGTFCARLPDISRQMVDRKLANASQSGAELLLGGDLGCLLNIAGRARREGLALEVRHIAELLADEMGDPAIGKAEPT